MEILNPSTKTVVDASERYRKFVSFRKPWSSISISEGAMKEFLLKKGMKFSFVVDLGRLYVILSKEEGFELRIDRSRGNTGIINSRMLIRTLKKKLPQIDRNGPKFTIRVSNTRINDCITFEILIDNNINLKKQ